MLPGEIWLRRVVLQITIPKAERVFIVAWFCHPMGLRSIMPPYFATTRSLSLRKIIDGTPYKGMTVTVLVMRPDGANPKFGGFFRKKLKTVGES